MKKYLSIIALAVAGFVSFTSCEEKMEDRVLTVPEQQDRMERTVDNFVAAVPAKEFSTLTHDVMDFILTYIQGDYNLQDITKLFNVYNETIIKTDFQAYTQFERMSIIFSNIYGTLDFGETALNVTQDPTMNGTTLKFNLGSDAFVAELKQVGEIHEYKTGYFRKPGSLELESGSSVRSQDYVELVLRIPDHITVQMTKNGQDYLSADLQFQLNLTPGKVDLSYDSFKLTTSILLNGYEVLIDRTSIDLKAQKVTFAITVSKGGAKILELNFDAEIGLMLVSSEVGTDKNDKTLFEDMPVPNKVKNIVLTATLMDDVRIEVKASNALQIASLLATGDATLYHPGYLPEAIYKDEVVKDYWKDKIDFLNKIASIELKFTDNVAVQAKCIAIPVYETDDTDGTFKLSLAPRIEYPDGSRIEVIDFAAGLDLGSLAGWFLNWKNMVLENAEDLQTPDNTVD